MPNTPILLASPLSNVSQLRPGAVVGFNYAFAKHDRSPIVLVTGVTTGASKRPLLEGINVHYLTPREVVGVLERSSRAPVTTPVAESEPGLSKAMRKYRTEGVRSPIVVDWRLFIARVAAMKDLDPKERAALMREVETRLASAKDIPVVSVIAERVLATMRTEEADA